MEKTRTSYPSEVTDAEWELLLPYLALIDPVSPQRIHDVREVFDAMRYVVKTECTLRFLPHDVPPWEAVYQQMRRWFEAGVFEEIAHDLRMIVRLVKEREAQPSAMILDGRTPQSTPESGGRVRRGEEEERVEGRRGRGYAG